MVDPSYSSYSQLFQLFPVIPSYSQLFPVIPSYSQLFPVIPSYSQLFPVIPSYSQLSPVIPSYSGGICVAPAIAPTGSARHRAGYRSAQDSHPVAVQDRRARQTVQRPGAAAPAHGMPGQSADGDGLSAALPTQQQGTCHAGFPMTRHVWLTRRCRPPFL